MKEKNWYKKKKKMITAYTVYQKHSMHSARTRDIPDPHSLVQGGRHNQVLRGVEMGAHHVVAVARQNAEDKATTTK